MKRQINARQNTKKKERLPFANFSNDMNIDMRKDMKKQIERT